MNKNILSSITADYLHDHQTITVKNMDGFVNYLYFELSDIDRLKKEIKSVEDSIDCVKTNADLQLGELQEKLNNLKEDLPSYLKTKAYGNNQQL